MYMLWFNFVLGLNFILLCLWPKKKKTENVKNNPGMLMFCKGRTTWQEIIKLQAAMVIHSWFCGLLV